MGSSSLGLRGILGIQKLVIHVFLLVTPGLWSQPAPGLMSQSVCPRVPSALQSKLARSSRPPWRCSSCPAPPDPDEGISVTIV